VSVAVPLDRLRAVLAERPPGAYLVTVSDDLRPHAVHVVPRWDGDALSAEVGKRSAANAAVRPSVSFVHPVRAADDYSLIVDGSARVVRDGDLQRVLVTPTKAVLHRPAATPDAASTCGADCVPLLPVEGEPKA
jgi:hypothetical protein